MEAAAREELEQTDGRDGPGALRFVDRPCVFVVRVFRAGPQALLVQILIGDREHDMTTRAQDAKPVRERLDRVGKVLEAVRAMHEIERLVWHFG